METERYGAGNISFSKFAYVYSFVFVLCPSCTTPFYPKINIVILIKLKQEDL